MVQKINGPALRAIREARGVSVRALAREVGADPSHLARVERGEKHGIGGETFARIVEVLAIDGRSIMANPFGVACVTALNVEQGGPSALQCESKTSTAA